MIPARNSKPMRRSRAIQQFLGNLPDMVGTMERREHVPRHPVSWRPEFWVTARADPLPRPTDQFIHDCLRLLNGIAPRFKVVLRIRILLVKADRIVDAYGVTVLSRNKIYHYSFQIQLQKLNPLLLLPLMLLYAVSA
jgi:hypothetical protein